MRTAIYHLKNLTPSRAKTFYTQIWKQLAEASHYLELSFYDWDVCFYPTNYDFLLEHKKFYLSATKDGYKLFPLLDGVIKEVLQFSKIKYKVEFKEFPE